MSSRRMTPRLRSTRSQVSARVLKLQVVEARGPKDFDRVFSSLPAMLPGHLFLRFHEGPLLPSRIAAPIDRRRA